MNSTITENLSFSFRMERTIIHLSIDSWKHEMIDNRNPWPFVDLWSLSHDLSHARKLLRSLEPDRLVFKVQLPSFTICVSWLLYVGQISWSQIRHSALSACSHCVPVDIWGCDPCTGVLCEQCNNQPPCCPLPSLVIGRKLLQAPRCSACQYKWEQHLSGTALVTCACTVQGPIGGSGPFMLWRYEERPPACTWSKWIKMSNVPRPPVNPIKSKSTRLM